VSITLVGTEPEPEPEFQVPEACGNVIMMLNNALASLCSNREAQEAIRSCVLLIELDGKIHIENANIKNVHEFIGRLELVKANMLDKTMGRR